jgi:hypothetical protein
VRKKGVKYDTVPVTILNPGDWVYRPRPRTTIIANTCDESDKYDGPFKVIKIDQRPRVRGYAKGTVFVLLDMPEGSQASPYAPQALVVKYNGPLSNETLMARGKPQVRSSTGHPNGDVLYDVEHVRAWRIREGALEYLVHWEGWPSEDDTWEPYTEWWAQYATSLETRAQSWVRVKEIETVGRGGSVSETVPTYLNG